MQSPRPSMSQEKLDRKKPRSPRASSKREDVEFRLWMYEKSKEVISDIMTSDNPTRTGIEELEKLNVFDFDAGRRIFAFLLNQYIADVSVIVNYFQCPLILARKLQLMAN